MLVWEQLRVRLVQTPWKPLYSLMQHFSQRFDKRRGLANGIAFAGAGSGGLFFPFIFTAALKNVGFGWTMRIWALILLVGAGTGLCFVKPRLPTIRATETDRQHSLGRWEALRVELAHLATPLYLLNVSWSFFSRPGLLLTNFSLLSGLCYVHGERRVVFGFFLSRDLLQLCRLELEW